MDILNYSKNFFNPITWNFSSCQNEIEKFVQAARNSGYKIIGFIDDCHESEEAKFKWKSRREANMSGETIRNLPYGISEILGEMFRQCDVEVHYSIIDNDDTLAYYANYYNCIVLSNDKDFRRYQPRNYIVY